MALLKEFAGYPPEYYNYGPTSTDNTYKGGGILGSIGSPRPSKYKLELIEADSLYVESIEVRWEDHFVKFFKTANTLVLAIPEASVHSILLVAE